jgi:hypothetical protein
MRRVSYVILIAALSLAGCSGIKITGVSKVPDFKISNYKTFGFHEVQVGGDAVSDVNFKPRLELLKEEIIKQMQVKGLTRTQSSPDLIVNIGVAVNEEVQTRETNFANPGDRHMAYMGARNYGWQSQEVAVGTYRDGSVKVDLVDKNSFKMVWTGTAESVLPNNQSKDISSIIKDAMTKLFAKL